MGDQFGQIAGRLSRLEDNINRLMAQQTDFATYGSAFPTDNLFNGRLFFRTDLGTDFYYDSATFNGPSVGWYKSSVGVTDSFNRANSTTTAGRAESGQAWIPQGGIAVGISSNRLYFPAPADGQLVLIPAYTNAPVAQMVAKGTVNAAAVISLPALVVLATDNANYIYFQLYNGNAELRKSDGGVITRIAFTAVSTPDNTDTFYTIKVDGLNITCYQNGTALTNMNPYVLTAAEAKFLAGDKAGVRLGFGGSPATPAGIDSFYVRQAS